MVKTKVNKKDKALLENHEGNTLEKEIDELIDREKIKGRIVNKLLDQTVPPTLKSAIDGISGARSKQTITN